MLCLLALTTVVVIFKVINTSEGIVPWSHKYSTTVKTTFHKILLEEGRRWQRPLFSNIFFHFNVLRKGKARISDN